MNSCLEESQIKAIKLMLSVMALAMLTALGVAYDGSEGFGNPNTGFGQQNGFAPGPNEMGAQYPDGQPDGMGPSDSMGGPVSMGSQGHNNDHGADSYGDHRGSDGHRGNYYDWLSPGYTYSYYWYPEYYPYGYYPYAYTYPTYYYYTNPTYYYTTPAYYPTYYYPYNWYDPWWSANAYGVAGVSHYSSSWSGSSHHGEFY